MNEPAKKRQKSESEMGNPVHLLINDHEEEQENRNQLDQQIEQEQNNADNIVIKDLMGSVRPEPQKVSSKLSFFSTIRTDSDL